MPSIQKKKQSNEKILSLFRLKKESQTDNGVHNAICVFYEWLQGDKFTLEYYIKKREEWLKMEV